MLTEIKMTGEELITAWDMYWITRCSSLKVMFLVMSIIATGALVAKLLVHFHEVEKKNWDMDVVMERRPEYKVSYVKQRKAIFQILPIAALLMAASALMPTTEEMAAIYVVPAIANNDDIQRIGGDLLKLTHEWVDELRPEPKK